MIARLVGRVLRCLLRGKWSSFTGTTEAERTGALPCQGAAFAVRDGDDRVVEGRLDIAQAMRHVLAFLLFEDFLFAFCSGGASAGCCWFRHKLISAFLVRPAVQPVSSNLPHKAKCQWLICQVQVYVFVAAFFLFATVPLRGPLRVRALVCVRWPRTGRLRRWR